MAEVDPSPTSGMSVPDMLNGIFEHAAVIARHTMPRMRAVFPLAPNIPREITGYEFAQSEADSLFKQAITYRQEADWRIHRVHVRAGIGEMAVSSHAAIGGADSFMFGRLQAVDTRGHAIKADRVKIQARQARTGRPLDLLFARIEEDGVMLPLTPPTHTGAYIFGYEVMDKMRRRLGIQESPV